MAALTPEQEFTARELDLLGFTVERVSDLLDVDVEAVRVFLARDQVDCDVETEVDAVADEPAVAVEKVAVSWPPPVDELTRWRTLLVGRGGGAAQVRVRTVPLWGRDVLINDANDVWCPCCRVFLSVAVLGRPGNRHPVGVVAPVGAVWAFDPDDDPSPSRARGSGHVDLMAAPW